jgi:GAF domain-containing protein
VRTFADQAVIAIKNARLFEEVQARTHALRESLEQQTATSEVLGAISRSKFKLQPVFDTIVETAARLCHAESAHVFTMCDGKYHLAASNQAEAEFVEYLRRNPIVPGQKGSVTGMAAVERRTIHVPDTLVEPHAVYGSSVVTVSKNRTVLSVPLLRGDEAIGVITLARKLPKAFTEKQIELVSTFADQAVIGIENTRLFEAEQESKRELQQSLEYQTATSEVLNVISRSPTDAQPVFKSIVRSAAMLFEPWSANVTILKNGMFHFEASASAKEQDASLIVERVRTVYPIPFDPINVPSARAIVERRIIELLDKASPETPEFSSRVQAVSGFRSMTFVPLLREGVGIGTIILTNREPGHRLTAKQRADQAVIAIENARLFEEVQARTGDLTESLNYQTAIADVLRIISRSPADIAPIMSAILRTARRLCGAEAGNVFALTGSNYRMIARDGEDISGEDAKILAEAVLEPGRSSMTGRVAMEGKTLQVADVRADPQMSYFRDHLGNDPRRTALGVPLLLSGKVIGVINLYRDFVEPFTDRQVALVETFADQAVIAIENARLFEAEQASKRELARSVEELESLGKVSQVVNSSLYVFDKTTSEFHLAAAHNMSAEHIAMVRAQPMRLNRVVVGECAMRREVVQIADLSRAPPSPMLDILLRTGVRAVLAVPLLHQAAVVGVLVVRRNQSGTFSQEIIRLVEAFCPVRNRG